MKMYKVFPNADLSEADAKTSYDIEGLEAMGYVEDKLEAYDNRVKLLQDEIMELQAKCEVRTHELRKIYDVLKNEVLNG